MEEILPSSVGIVGTHPLFGPQSAPNAIVGQKVAVCKVRGNSDRIEAHLSGLGLNVIKCSPDEHDRQMAVSQALTHFIGRGVANGGFGKVELSTKTFDNMMDVVRIIGGNTQELFEDMQRLNPHASEVRQKFLNSLIDLDKGLK